MAKRKKPLSHKLLSLFLFLTITWIVFNFGAIVKKTMVTIGWADLNWVSITEIPVETDDTLDSRPRIMNFNENVLIYFENTIALYDKEGNYLGKKGIQSVNNDIVGLEDYVVIVDKLSGNFVVIDYLGNDVADFGPIGPIKDAIAASENTFVVMSENNYFDVYSYNGNLEFSKELPKGELLGLDLSNEKDYLLLTLLVSSDDKYNSRLLTYDIYQNSLIGGNDNVNTVVYGSKIVHEEIIIVDLKGQHAYVKGDPENITWSNERSGDLIRFKIDTGGNVFEITELEEVQDLLGQSEYHLTCRNKDGKLQFDIVLDHAFEAMDILEGKVLLTSDKKLGVFNYAGELVTALDSTKKIYGAAWLNSNRIVIEYNDYLEIVELKY